MAIMAKANDKQFTPAPEGLWPAVCVDVIDLGFVETKFGIKQQVKFVWQLELRDEEGRRFQIRQRYSLSLHSKSRLRPMLEAWRGRRFTDDELRGFDLEKCIGTCCQIQVVHDLGDEGRVYANAQAVVPYPKNMPRLAAEDYVRECDKAQQQHVGETGKPADDDDSIPF